MMKSKKEDQEKEALRQELGELNAKGAAFAPPAALPAKLCVTRHPMQLARKLSKRYPRAEFTIAVTADGYDDQEYAVQYRAAWKDVAEQGPNFEYVRAAVEAARKQLKEVQELPLIESLRLYAQGVADALAESEKLRKELDEVKRSRRDDGCYPRFAFHPFFR